MPVDSVGIVGIDTVDNVDIVDIVDNKPRMIFSGSVVKTDGTGRLFALSLERVGSIAVRRLRVGHIVDVRCCQLAFVLAEVPPLARL